MSELVLPIALWNGPPPHSVTSILFILPRSVIVTGSSTGQLCIWSIETEKPNKEGGLTPLIFCMGHNAPITHLIDCNFEEKDAFISLSTDGIMHVWSAQDGKCLGGTQFTTFYPLCITCIPGERKVVAIAGCHSDIEIIDVWTLKTTSTLRGHQDWVTCLGSTLCNGEPILMSGSRDGLVHFWSLKASEDFPLRTVCFDEGPSPDIHPLAAVVAPDVRSFVLITPREWSLYTAQNSRLLYSVVCPNGSEWLGAKYLDSDTLLTWTSHAVAAAYRLSIPSNAEPLSLAPIGSLNLNAELPRSLSAHFDPALTADGPLKAHAGVHPDSKFLPLITHHQDNASAGKQLLPTLLYTINEFPSESLPSVSTVEQGVDSSAPKQSVASDQSNSEQPPSTLNTVSPSVSPLDSIVEPRYESSFSQFATCSDNFFAVGDTTGRVGMWIVRTDNFTPWGAGRISDGWKGVEPPSKAVTTSIVLEDILLLIRGHENGQISTCTLPTDPFPKYNKAHSARVNCLLCSPIIGSGSSSSLNSSGGAAGPSGSQKRFLVSGSDDFTIKVWELSTFELLHTFTHHTGPITWLFPPPPRHQHHAATEVFWDNTFFAVSEDKCVGLYSMDSMVCRHLFGVHPALVSSVKCKREQDYLLVECVDGCVAVWEMGTGDLEGIVYGQVAREISENSDTIWTSFNHPHGASSANPNATSAITEPSGTAGGAGTGPGTNNSGIGVRVTLIPSLLHRTPIQILYLDIKQIIRELYRTLGTPAIQHVPPGMGASSSSSSSHTTGAAAQYKKPLPAAPSVSSLANNGVGDIRTSAQAFARNRQSLQISSTSGSSTPSATSLPAYQIFSYLIPWGVDKPMDSLCKKEMMLRPPVPDFAFGMKGDGGNISVLVPSASGIGRWQCSPELTAIITLSAVSLAKALLNLGDGKNSCIQILSYYCALLPETLGPRSSYVDPSLPLLASYWLDPLEDIMSASRSILVSTIDRLSPDARRDLTQSVATQLRQTSESNTRGLLVVVMGIIGAERPEALDEAAARSAALELLKILYKGGTGPFTQAAVELLGKGFASWRPHIKDVARLIRGLFTLSLQGDALGQTAHHALMLIGAQDPKQFILCIGAEIHGGTSHSHAHTAPNNSSSAVMVLGAMVKKDPCALLAQLPRLVETVVKSLDPHTPALRDACLKATTAVLHVMVKKYPMVSFHQESQRLAVGTSENVIIIYDLKTATRWHVLEKHKNAVSAVAFNDNGKALSSYSIMEASVRIWQTGTSFFGILGSEPQCIKTFNVSKPSKPIAPQVQLETVRLQWASPSTLTLFRGWEQGTTFTVDPIV